MTDHHVTMTGFGDLGTRDAYGVALRELGHKNENIYVLTADCLGSVRAKLFATDFPERTLNFGIAEANMVSVAAGLALEGKIPFVTGFAMLMSLRACEQVRTDIAYPNLNVKIVGTHSGLTMGGAGTTHHCLEDIAVMRAMANMVVVVPADGMETARAAHAISERVGPTYMRLGRDYEPTVTDFDYKFVIGRSVLVIPGSDVALIACGSVLHVAIDAASLLKEQGISARVLNMHTVKPIDREAIKEAARDTAGIVTVEEHNVYGGLGSAVAEVVTEECPTFVRRIGVPDVYAGTGQPDELREKHRITPPEIARTAREVVEAKRRE